MQEIKNNYQYVSPVNAIVDNGFIIPGINGKKINLLDSYYNMQDDGYFNKDKLIYEIVQPTFSLKDHNNLVIKANPLKRSISVVSSNTEIINFSLANNISITTNTRDKVDYVKVNNYNYYKVPIMYGNVYYIEDLSLKNYLSFCKILSFFDMRIIPLDDLISEE